MMMILFLLSLLLLLLLLFFIYNYCYYYSYYGAYMNMRTYANEHICNFILGKFFSHFYTRYICNSILSNTLGHFYRLNILISQEIKMEFNCEKCHYFTKVKCDFAKHMASKRHSLDMQLPYVCKHEPYSQNGV